MFQAQTPAVGIMKSGDFGDAVAYHVECECQNPDDAHDVWVEAEDHGISVMVYVTAHTKFWEKNRWKYIWQLLTKGRAEMQATVILTQQAAMNYASALTQSIDDVSKFRKNRDGN